MISNKKFMKYFFGILIMVLGVFMVLKTPWFISNFGTSAWAENKLGGGGTRLMYKILGVVFVFGALMGMTGMLGRMILGIFGRYFGM